MDPDNLISVLIQWTPKLWQGFWKNLLISALAMIAGSIIGLVIAALRKNPQRMIAATGNGFTNLMRNVPSFVLLYYLAFILPSSIQIGQFQITIEPLHKAVLALTFPVVGFTSDALIGFWRTRKQKDINPYVVFWSSWTSYFIIVLMASSTASVIGVGEIVATAKLAIAAENNPNYALYIYLFAATWFLMAGLLISTLSKIISNTFLKETQ